jgi:hypothetical protein
VGWIIFTLCVILETHITALFWSSKAFLKKALNNKNVHALSICFASLLLNLETKFNHPHYSFITMIFFYLSFMENIC